MGSNILNTYTEYFEIDKHPKMQVNPLVYFIRLEDNRLVGGERKILKKKNQYRVYTGRKTNELGRGKKKKKMNFSSD